MIIYCVSWYDQKNKNKLSLLFSLIIPDVQEHQLSGAVHIGLIGQVFEEAGERGSKPLAALTRGRTEEKHQDAVLQARDDLALCVQVVLVRVVLHQDPVNEQIHHDGMGQGRRRRLTGRCKDRSKQKYPYQSTSQNATTSSTQPVAEEEDMCRFILNAVWFNECRLYVFRSVRPLTDHTSPSCWQLNQIILTVAYLLQILSPWRHRSEKKPALKISAFFFFSTLPVSSSNQFPACQFISLQSLTASPSSWWLLTPSSSSVPLRSTSLPLSGTELLKGNLTEGQEALCACLSLCCLKSPLQGCFLLVLTNLKVCLRVNSQLQPLIKSSIIHFCFVKLHISLFFMLKSFGTFEVAWI